MCCVSVGPFLFRGFPHSFWRLLIRADDFSQTFEKGFMDLLTRRFGTRRIQANYVYNEYIQDKLHVSRDRQGVLW